MNGNVLELYWNWHVPGAVHCGVMTLSHAETGEWKHNLY